jgi:acyl carrier protein
MTLEERVIAAISVAVEKKIPLTAATNLRQEAGIDSFGILMILNSLEDAFGISIDESDFERVAAVSDIVLLLQTKYQVREEAA